MAPDLETHLNRRNSLDQSLLDERFQASVDHCLVQVRFGLEVLRPDAWKIHVKGLICQ
jgi:hypothetical protein